MGTRLVDELLAALDAQTVTVPAEDTIGRVIGDLTVELTRLAAARDKLATEVEDVFARHPQAPVLLSILGIGARTAARILTEIGDVTRFPTAGHLATYAGLAPVTKQSGRSVNGEHIHKMLHTGLSYGEIPTPARPATLTPSIPSPNPSTNP